MDFTSFARRGLFFLPLAATLAACGTSTEGELLTFAGGWCALRSLGSDNLPAPGASYVGMQMVEQADGRLLGTGATSRPSSDTIFAARFRGDIVNGRGIIDVSDLDEATETPGPSFTMDLSIQGARDLVGTMTGDPDFTGPITLVRLGPRCFLE